MRLENATSPAALVWACLGVVACAAPATSGAQPPAGRGAQSLEREFRQQANRCGVSLENSGRAGAVPVKLAGEGRELILRGNVNDPKNRCMSEWGAARGMIVVFGRH